MISQAFLIPCFFSQAPTITVSYGTQDGTEGVFALIE